GDANHLNFADFRMEVEKLLDFPRVDVLATTDDHVLQTSDDVHVTVFSHDRTTAGVHPAAAADPRARRAGIVPIAEHHRISPRAQLARFATRNGRARLRVDDLAFEVRVDGSDCGDTSVKRIVDE